MDLGLQGKRALVTGASSGIGEAIAVLLAKEGVSVAVNGRDEARTRRTAASIVAAGGHAVAVVGDLKDDEGRDAVARMTDEALGGVDILVNNAGGTTRHDNPTWDQLTSSDYIATINSNFVSAVALSRHFAPGMIERKWGRIINIGGTDAYWGKVRRAHGVSAKLGLVGLTRAMALEVARFGVTINVVIPGTIDTQRPHPEWYPELNTGYAERLERIPMARLGDTQQVANACLFLASELASFTTAQELFASGGAVPLVRQTLDEYSAEEF